MPDITYIIFLFMVGACIGSFLNVVVWRLPRVELPEKFGILDEFVIAYKGLTFPPSHCPKCGNRLKWHDNIPIFGWIKLKGRCRFCREPISKRYPIIELVTALLFVGYYVAYFMMQVRTCCPHPQVLRIDSDAYGNLTEVTHPLWIWSEAWPIYLLYMALISGLLAASLIDAELYIIPIQIPWTLAVLGFIMHAIVDRPTIPGSLNLVGTSGPPLAALAAGGAVGLVITIALWMRGLLPTTFPEGDPLLEIEIKQLKEEIEKARLGGEAVENVALPPVYTRAQIRAEISKEMLFLLPSMILGGAFLAATTWLPPLHDGWQHLVLGTGWLNGLLGSLLGAMTGAFVVWIIRILGTIGFGRVAMGLGDMHLMFGVGAIIGAAGATIAFFIAPFFAILTTLYRLISRKGHEIPLGPYLSLATAAVMLFYCPIVAYLEPGLAGLMIWASDWLHGLFH